jgi:ribosomal protein S18 acetylase RimI-like enzyme
MKNLYREIKVNTWYLVYNQELPIVEENYSVLWEKPDPDAYLRLYHLVGDPWGWTGRQLMSPDELNLLLQDDQLEVWCFYQQGVLCGFFEIDFRQKGEAEIVYLGLLPEFTGKGLGQKFIKSAVAMAARKGDKVWLHTCEHDHVSALNAYLKAGFCIEKEVEETAFYPTAFLNRKAQENHD